MSPQGILYRMNRSIQVEGAFGVLKNFCRNLMCKEQGRCSMASM